MLRWLAFLAVLLLAGCSAPVAHPTLTRNIVQEPPVYRLVVRIVQEVPTGPPLPDAEVYVAEEAEASPDPAKLPLPRGSDDRGEVALQFPAPTSVLVEAFGPGRAGGGWTREGARILVGDTVVADGGLQVVGHTVVLPLLHKERKVVLNGTWGPAVASLAPNGTIVPAEHRIALDLAEPYASRLSSVRLDLAWVQSPPAFGDLYAGLARGDGPTLRGQDTLNPPLPGTIAESVVGLPSGAGPLEAVALTDKAVTGALPLHFTGDLLFSGHPPPILPVPSCLAMAACLPIPLDQGS